MVIQILIKLEIKTLGCKIKISEVSLANWCVRHGKKNFRFWWQGREVDTSVKENVKYRNILGTKHPENVRQYWKTKPMDDRNRGLKRNPSHKIRKYF